MSAADHGALDAVLERLRCPHCAGSLTRAGGVLACERGHRYDIARQGHVTLFPPRGRRHPGDAPAMLDARDAFLRAGHYAPITDALVAAARAAGAARCAVDLGAGTGHQLAALLDALPDCTGIAVDAAPAALRRAVRAHARIAGVGCDVWEALPLRDGAADLVVNVFSPRNGAEIARVLAPGGALIVVTPAPGHLEQLREAAGLLEVDAEKPARLRAALPQFEAGESRAVTFELALDHTAARTLVVMGPSARHIGADELERRVQRLPERLPVTASVNVETFRVSDPPGASRSG